MTSAIDNSDRWLSEELQKRFDKIKDSIIKLHNDNEKDAQLKWYTPHGPTHYRIVESRIYQLIPNGFYEKLSENERFFLLASAWLHDIGMVKGIFDNDKHLTDEEIRENHHIRSEKYLIEKFIVVGVEETEKEVFGLLARFHRRRSLISECPKYLPIMGHGRIRVRLLSAYLRLADSLHIDQSRVPANLYAITLAYNIPMTSKLHWLRSMFVIGIAVDVDNKEIVVHFKYPHNIDAWQGQNEKAIKRTLESIYEVIIQDLIDELTTVKEVLFYSDITYFLSIKMEIICVEFDNQLVRDIKTVLNYYFLMDNPSSSALCRLVLESVRGILDAHSQGGSINYEASNKAVAEFLKEIETKILITRQCHTGLRIFVDNIWDFINKNKMLELKEWVPKIEEQLDKKRNDVRKTASFYFKWKKQQYSTPKKYFDVLLYGYSELVIKSLCGFRDVIVDELLKKFTTEKHSFPKIHTINFETEASNFFRIFVCEGQPKNRTAWGGRIIYHDGARYSLSLAERGFTNVYIIADAIVGSLISPETIGENTPNVDFVMVGANGFNEKQFKHSAGHATIAAITKVIPQKGNPPDLILSIITDKFDEKEDESAHTSGKVKLENDRITIIDGWRFRSPFLNEPVRNNIFISQDPKLRDTLENEAPNILLYNPREDIIPINWVDVIISEKAWLLQKDEPEWGGKYIAKKEQNTHEIITP